MLRTTLLAGAIIALTSATALAHSCPNYAGTIEAALAASDKSDAEKAEIMVLVDEGMALHNAGDHHESEHALASIMVLLLDESSSM